MRLPRWVPVVTLLSIMAFLGGCGLTGGSSSPSKSGSGLAITTSSLPAATVSQSYAGSLQAAGGTAPYSWSVTSGALPTGLTLTTAGQISGTPTQLGSYSFQTQVTDAAKQSTSANFSMQVMGPTPSITAISPQYGSTSGGTTVTISGNNLQSGATVTFGGIDAMSSNVANSSQMTAVTPAHAAGSVDVAVTNTNGKSATLPAGFGYGNAAPSVSSINPASGPTTGGTTVTITGANFVFGAIVLFAGVQAPSVAVMSPTQIQAVSPAGTAGSANVSVKNPDGQTATLSGGYTYGSTNPSSTLLSGCTVNASNQPVCGSNVGSAAVPSGWTLAFAEGFDTGSLASPTLEDLHGMSIACGGNTHTGNCAARGYIGGGDYNTHWTLYGTDHVASSPLNTNTVYVSYWEYDDPQGKFNVDFYIGARVDYARNDDLPFNINTSNAPPEDNGCMFNCTVAEMDFYGSPNLKGLPVFAVWGPGGVGGNWGKWTQWEWTITTNTPGQSNGSFSIWQNGKLLLSRSNMNLNGTFDMSSADIQVGGVYTYLVDWMDAAHTICPTPAQITAYRTNYGDWSKPDPCPDQAPPGGYGFPFNRYFDDIIVLKK